MSEARISLLASLLHETWEVLRMSVQRPWMTDHRECLICAATLGRGGTADAGSVRARPRGLEDPAASIGGGRWAQDPGWAVGGLGMTFWVFFTTAEAPAVFARSAMQSCDLSSVEIRHAYTESVHTGDPDLPVRRFLGIAGPAGRCLRNVKLLQTWVDQVALEERIDAAAS